MGFLLTRLSQGVTISISSVGAHLRFLLTRLSQGVTDDRYYESDMVWISTHTPLARRDDMPGVREDPGQISTHTPLARRDFIGLEERRTDNNFYSHASRKA